VIDDRKADVRYGAHFGHNADIARGPLSADFVAEVGAAGSLWLAGIS